MAHTASETHIENLLEEPKLYRVLLLNDDYTAMDFVTQILIEVFDKTSDEATAIMLKIHNEGKGVCGIYTYDIAELKSQIVSQKAKQQVYPLRVIIEEMPS
ncbi:MAG: ATP-dependent Clp protease adaptor ClpS [Helicobacter sp.]|uniref:ATP-dependent Clp protease adaptor ClpS n=1 Tax=Helicobacter sp. TaxID=218 RepID=UPI0025C20C15|nr:ATP-dependent Clp protease adaptor ClpS [Helicobacter sp.]MCH5312807.1 ATP-dependent Clp protease adaptor ClpS [Helicobacter sp.]